jgi:hypothetical protein
MPRFWALWLVSIILRGAGVVWIVFTILTTIVMAVSAQQVQPLQTIPLPQMPTLAPFVMPEMPNFNVITNAAAGVTVWALVFGFVLSLFYGLILYAVGQFIVLMLSIEQSVRLNGGRAEVPENAARDMWNEPASAPRRPRR